MKIVAIIPARMGSSRFPGKPLAPILGIPMIEHVFQRTRMCRKLDEVFVATCDDEIFKSVEAFGGRAVMTSPTHERASDRIAEAAADMDCDVIVMVQGDEPMTVPEMIDESLAPFVGGNAEIACVNLTARIQSREEFQDPNSIKVVMDRDGYALYMSREPIPTLHLQDFERIPAFKQVCIIPFTAAALQEFTRLDPTPLEVAESIDMMRFIEHGHRVKMIETSYSTHAVDNPADLELVQELLSRDPLTQKYLRS
ncbi:MAG: 3-deoxy-manno-octulosonate cytidylyltransferase [Deltaproteobacteria bacterium]|jgi:3-deoxy-manno-octulosonate cytidylyltransferase (CMP-KDO synthetase)|nr:3-deoxy-manno-octulosonate cytidylyltransferase [Deltaproteobacteria bacterium]